ncbi:MAG TPA: lysylphosphatidylglycerol synthase transmembrane domain-containing protein [Bacteroidota bacterium]|nr:lysylphosphatidylglycerol synthase transmembrane domain-containing protein [Bacteroidota bacterium]
MTRLKKTIRYTVSFLVMVVFLYLAFRGQDFGAIWNSLVSVHWTWVALLIVGGILSHLARAWRWQYLLVPIKDRVTLRNSFSAVMIGYMVNNFLPRVGEVVRPYSLGKHENISKSAAFGSVIIERILDVITFFSILLAVMFVYSGSFVELFPSLASMETLFLFGSVAAFAFFVVLFFKAAFFFTLLKKLLVVMPEKLRGKFNELFDSFVSGFEVSKRPNEFWMIIVTSYLVQGLYLLLMYIPFFAFPEMAGHSLDFGAATILLVASTVAFALPTPSGFGTYHSFTSFVLMKLYHVDGVTALSYTILTHEVGVFLTLVIGAYYFFRDHVRVAEMVEAKG